MGAPFRRPFERRLEFDLTMDGVRPATWAELLDHELIGLPLLIFGGRIIAPLATVACKSDQVSNHFGTPCLIWRFGAHDGNRTRDLFLTKEVLYRLSYVGN